MPASTAKLPSRWSSAARGAASRSSCSLGPWKPRADIAIAMLSHRAIRLEKSLETRPTQMAKVPRMPCCRQSMPRDARPKHRLRASSKACRVPKAGREARQAKHCAGQDTRRQPSRSLCAPGA